MPFRPKTFRPPQWRPPEKKIADPFYSSKPRRDLRAKRLALDRCVCVVEGCKQRAVVADHLVARPLRAALARTPYSNGLILRYLQKVPLLERGVFTGTFFADHERAGHAVG